MKKKILPLIINKSPFSKKEENNKQYLQSLFSNLSIKINKQEKKKKFDEKDKQEEFNKQEKEKNFNEKDKQEEFNEKDYAFTRNFIELLNVIHLGLATKTPVILEGKTGYCKSTAIKYISQSLGFKIIRIKISKSTQTDFLFGKTIIKNDIENNEIKIEESKTELLEVLENEKKCQETIIIFEYLENCSIAIFEILSSIFSYKQDNILLPNGEIIKKYPTLIIGIVNSEKDYLIRTKIPSSIMSNCIYYIVDEPSKYEIGAILNKKMEKSLIKKDNLKNEKIELFSTYLKVSNILKENECEDKITLHDINKYIILREISDETIEKDIIKQFIFYYKFHNEEIKKIIQNELNFYSLKLNPSFNYENNKKVLIINFSDKKSKTTKPFKLEFQNDNENLGDYSINLENINIQDEISTLTKSEKYCFIFLALSIKTMEKSKKYKNPKHLGDRVCIIQGETASGKTYVISKFAKILGKKLLVYQMNSDTTKSIFLNQKILSNKISFDIYEVKKSFNNIKFNQDLNVDFEPNNEKFHEWTFGKFKQWYEKIDLYIKNNNFNENKITNSIKEIKELLFKIIHPVNKFFEEKSKFIEAIEKGYWVLIESIESSPEEIGEILSGLCGLNPEFNLIDEIKFNKDNINPNFHLFITYSPNDKSNDSKLFSTLISKSFVFSLPPLDSDLKYMSKLFYSNLKNNNYPIEYSQQISTRLSNFHNFIKNEGLKNKNNFTHNFNLTIRKMIFSLKEFPQISSSKIDDENLEKNYNIKEKIGNCLEYYYWNSFTGSEEDKKLFKEESLKVFKGNPIIDDELKENNFLEIYKEGILKDLRNIQNYCKNIALKDNNFNFTNFLKKFMEIKINDIEEINFHLIDTLNFIDYYSKINSLDIRLLDNFYQIRICSNFLNQLIESEKKQEGVFSEMKINSEDLLKFENFKPIIMKLNLLLKLLEEGLFEENISHQFFNQNISKMLKSIIEFEDKKEKNELIEFIRNLNQSKQYLNVIDSIFPYNKFNKNLSEITYFIPLIRDIYENKIPFKIELYNSTFNFFEDNSQNNKITLKFKIQLEKEKEKKIKRLLLANGTKIEFLFKNVDKKKYQIKNEDANLKNTKEIIKTIRKILFILKTHNEDIEEKEFDILSNNFNKINIKKKSFFLIENLFPSNKNNIYLIPKIWNIIYNFYNTLPKLSKSNSIIDFNNKNPLTYYIQEELNCNVDKFLNKFSVESEKLLYKSCLLIFDKYYESFERIINFTKSSINFSNKNSILKEIELKIFNHKEKTKIYERDVVLIENEINNINEIYKLDEWNPQTIIEKLTFEKNNLMKNANLVKIQIEINEKINKFKELVQKLETMKKKSKIYQKIIENEIKNINEMACVGLEKIQKMDDTEKQNYKEIIELKYEEYEKKINELEKISKNEDKNYYNEIPWPQEVFENFSEKNCNSDNYELDKILLWYNDKYKIIKKIEERKELKYNEKVKLINDDSIKIIGNYILNKNSSEISIYDLNIMKNIINSEFINKMIKSDIYNKIDILDEIINSYEKREEIDNILEIFEMNNVIKSIQLDSELFLPEFKPIDFLFLFIQFSLNNKDEPDENNFILGPLLNNNFDLAFRKLIKFYKKEYVDDFSNYSLKISKYIFQELFRNEKEINKIEEMDESSFKNELRKKIQLSKNPILENLEIFLIISQKLKNKNNYSLKLDDVSFLDNKICYITQPEICNKYPSLVFFFLKNPKIPELLIEKLNKFKNKNNKKLSIDIKEKYIKINSIPFFIYCLRKITSLNIIQYYDQTNIFKDVIEKSLKKLIKSNVDKKEKISIYIFNLILENPPLELLNINTNILNKFLKSIGKETNLKDNLKPFYKELIDNFILQIIEKLNNNDNIFDELDKNFELIDFLKKPSDYIYSYIEKSIDKAISDVEKEFKQNLIKEIKAIVDLKQKISKLKDNCKSIINSYKKFKKEETEESLKTKRNNNIQTFETTINNYNTSYNELNKNESKKDDLNFQKLCLNLDSLLQNIKGNEILHHIQKNELFDIYANYIQIYKTQINIPKGIKNKKNI